MHNLIKSSTGHIIFFFLCLLNANIFITAAPAIELKKSGDKVYGSVRNNEMNMYFVNTDASFTLSLNYVELVTVYIRSKFEPTLSQYDYTIYSSYPSQEILVYTNMTYFIGVSTTSTTSKSYTLELKKSTTSNGGGSDSGISGGIIALIAIIVAIVVLSSIALPILIIALVCCGVCGCGIVSCGIGGATALHANAPTPQPSTSTTTTVTQTTYGGGNGQPVHQQQQPMEKPYYSNSQQPPYNDIPMQPMPIPVLAQQQTNPISSMHSMNSWEGSQISLNSGFSSQAQLYENLQPTCPTVEEEEEPNRRELVIN